MPEIVFETRTLTLQVQAYCKDTDALHVDAEMLGTSMYLTVLECQKQFQQMMKEDKVDARTICQAVRLCSRYILSDLEEYPENWEEEYDRRNRTAEQFN